jgi:hypothetical protein
MDDNDAIVLLKRIEQYALASVKEGMTLREVTDMTIGQLVEDIVDTTPDHLQSEIGVTARELYELRS